MTATPHSSDHQFADVDEHSSNHSRHAAGKSTGAQLGLLTADFLSGFSGLIHSLVVWIIGITAFILPFVYAGWTVEYLRYNKLMVVLVATFLVIILWAIRIVLEKEIRVKRTILDIPILGLLVAATLSLLASQIQGQSFWGTFPNFEDSYLLLFCFVILYYALVNHLRDGKDWLLIIGMVLASAALLAGVTLLQYLEVYLLPFGEISRNRLFTPFGTIFQVGFFLAILAPLASGFFIGSISNKRWTLAGLVAVLYLASLTVFGIIDYWPVWTIAAFGILISMLIGMTVMSPSQRNLAFIPLGLFILTLVAFKVGDVRAVIIGDSTPPQPPITLSLGSSFAIARESFNQNLFVGVGQGNYGYAYKSMRPVSFNQEPDWLLNYNRPTNSYFLIFTTMGVLGLAALVFLTGKIVWLVIKAMVGYSMQKDADPAVIGLFVSLASYVLVLLLSWETIPLQMLFWVLLVLAVFIGFEPGVPGIKGEKVFSLKLATDGGKQQQDFLSYGVAGVAVVLGLFVLFQTNNAYAVDMRLRRAINAGNEGDTNTSLIEQNRVVTSDAAKDHHLRGVAILLHNQGVQSEISQDDEDQQRQDIERKRAFFREGVRFARLAADMNPSVSENHEVLLGIYATLSDYGINRIDQVPLSNLMLEIRNQLSALTPTEVTWRIRMANYHIREEEYEQALSLLGQANILKGNLVDIHYLAALAFGGAGEYQNAINEANVALRSLEPDHPWATDLNELVQEWNAEAGTTGQTTTPTAASSPAATAPVQEGAGLVGEEESGFFEVEE